MRHAAAVLIAFIAVAASGCNALDPMEGRGPVAPAWSPGHTYVSEPDAMTYTEMIGDAACPHAGSGRLVVDASGAATLTVSTRGTYAIIEGACKLLDEEGKEAVLRGTASTRPAQEGAELVFTACNKELGASGGPPENHIAWRGETMGAQAFVARVDATCTQDGTPRLRIEGQLREEKV